MSLFVAHVRAMLGLVLSLFFRREAFPNYGNVSQTTGGFPEQREESPNQREAFPNFGRCSQTSGGFPKLREASPLQREAFPNFGSVPRTSGRVPKQREAFPPKREAVPKREGKDPCFVRSNQTSGTFPSGKQRKLMSIKRYKGS